MKHKLLWYLGLVLLVISQSCSDDGTPGTIPPPVITPPPIGNIVCKVEEIEFRNQNDMITSVREFTYDVNRSNRLATVSIIEVVNGAPLNLRFEFKYSDDASIVPRSAEEVFGGDVVTRIDFKFDTNDNLVEFTTVPVLDSSIPPESHVFHYEPSDFADDSVNTRIITFDINNLTRDWIDVFPAVFTNGSQRITRFDRISFRGDLFEYCEFSYDDEGLLEEIVCRNAEFVLTEVWNFTYTSGRLTSALRQLPDFRAMSDYGYDSQGKPITMTSTTNGLVNWTGSYFYLCR